LSVALQARRLPTAAASKGARVAGLKRYRCRF